MKYWKAVLYNLIGKEIPEGEVIEGATDIKLTENEEWILAFLLKTQQIGIIILSISLLSLLVIDHFYFDLSVPTQFTEYFSLIFGANIGIMLFAPIFGDRFVTMLFKKQESSQLRHEHEK